MEDLLIRIAYIEKTRRSTRLERDDYGVKDVEVLVPEKRYCLVNPNLVAYVMRTDKVTVGGNSFPAVKVVFSVSHERPFLVMLEEDFYDAFGYVEDTFGTDEDFYRAVSEAIGEAET